MLEDPAGPGHHGSCATSADNNEDGSNGSWMRWPQSRARVISITGGYDPSDMEIPRGVILKLPQYSKILFPPPPGPPHSLTQPPPHSLPPPRLRPRSAG